MKTTMTDGQMTRWTGAFFSSRYFLVRAVALVIFFAVAYAAGLREYTSFISGTTASPSVSMADSALWGTIYLALYMGCVVVAPILVLAAGLLTWWEPSRETVNRSAENPSN